MESASPTTDKPRWYVLRDLRRANARLTAYSQLADEGYEVFTPLHWQVIRRGAVTTRRCVPVIPDLLFIHTTRTAFDPRLRRIPTLQYRYARGSQATPMVIGDHDMNLFMTAVSTTPEPRYFSPDEVTPAMCGRRVRIIGGPLDGYTGHLLSVRGTRSRRLLINLIGIITVAVEVEPQYIQLL